MCIAAFWISFPLRVARVEKSFQTLFKVWTIQWVDFRIIPFLLFIELKVYLIWKYWTCEGEVRKRATSIMCSMLNLNHQRKEEVKMVTEKHRGCMDFWSYFLKTLISGKELLEGGEAGDFLHLEEQLTIAPVIECCVSFPRIIELCHESPLP